ncbi:MAG TPA: hypothetical protein PKG77_02765 [Phycisphaerae bacterium]|nr:hypothetical protein [Phycisphaerae bacterium]HQL72535.1 hypothetical protein [Phycisphaerae bacterium]
MKHSAPLTGLPIATAVPARPAQMQAPQHPPGAAIIDAGALARVALLPGAEAANAVLTTWDCRRPYDRRYHRSFPPPLGRQDAGGRRPRETHPADPPAADTGLYRLR